MFSKVAQNREAQVCTKFFFCSDCAKCYFFVQKCSARKAKTCAFFGKNCAKVLRMETLAFIKIYHSAFSWIYFVYDLGFPTKFSLNKIRSVSIKIFANLDNIFDLILRKFHPFLQNFVQFHLIKIEIFPFCIRKIVRFLTECLVFHTFSVI